MTVKSGKGFVPAEANKEEDQPIGYIPLDASFAPIRKVNYVVTQARVGQRTDYDKLTMEVWTDGSITPENAVAFAAKILKEHLSMFINFEEEPLGLEEKAAEEPPTLNENLYRSVNELELSVRAANCLSNANYPLYRRVGAEDRAGDAQDQEFRPQVLERDQRDPHGNGAAFGNEAGKLYASGPDAGKEGRSRMRHLKAGRRLSRTTEHRLAMLRNLITSLLERGAGGDHPGQGQRGPQWAEKVITLAKRGDLHARRLTLAVVRSKKVVAKLFSELRERYQDRPGGYTRIIPLGVRLGDGAPMSILELVDRPETLPKAKKKKAEAS